MTTVQVADALGVSERHVRELIAAGEIKAEKIGGVWAIPHRDIAALKARNPGGQPKSLGRRKDRAPGLDGGAEITP